MKLIKFANHRRCAEVAQQMNPNHKVVSDNMTRGSSYYAWNFSDDAVALVSTSGEGKLGGRFTDYYLVKGTARKVGREHDNLEFFNERITV